METLVPADHRLRRIDAVLDLSFVHEAVPECYSAGRGRPSVDPELALRMMEIGMHAGMRWFCRLNFHDPVPDHSTLSRLRNERWAESGLFGRLFDEVPRQCGEVGLTSGRHVSVDGTEVKADASMKSFRPRGPRRLPPESAPQAPSAGAVAREPQPEGAWQAHGERLKNETHRSTSDPDTRLYRKGKGREARLCYLAHDLIDTKSRVILRRRASRATGTAERAVALEMLDGVLEKREALGLPGAPAEAKREGPACVGPQPDPSGLRDAGVPGEPKAPDP